MQCVCEQGVLLDENKGSFVSEDGKTLEYHNARFLLSSEGNKIVKARLSDDAKLPAPLETVRLIFDVDAGERYCRLNYVSFTK